MGMPLYVTNYFSLAAFKVLALFLTISILIMLCHGVGLFTSILFGTLCASWSCMTISFTKLGKFSFISFSNRFPLSYSFSSPSVTPMMQMLEHLKLFQRLLTLASFFWILFFFLLFSLVVFCFLIFQIIDLTLSLIHSTIVSL